MSQPRSSRIRPLDMSDLIVATREFDQGVGYSNDNLLINAFLSTFPGTARDTISFQPPTDGRSWTLLKAVASVAVVGGQTVTINEIRVDGKLLVGNFSLPIVANQEEVFHGAAGASTSQGIELQSVLQAGGIPVRDLLSMKYTLVTTTSGAAWQFGFYVMETWEPETLQFPFRRDPPRRVL